MILLLKVKQMFLKCFHDNAIKIFSWWPKYCLDLHSVRFAHVSFDFFFFFTCLCSLMQLNWNILREMRNDSRFEHFPWKNVRFCLISIVWVHFIQKTEELWFWKPLEYFNIFDKKMMSNLNMFYQAVSDSV